MDELIYGVWKGRAYDNRRTIDGKAPEGLPLSEFLAFNSGNPVAGFAGPQGFLMFDNRVTLADVLLSYYKRVRELACGRCTPCRAGGVMIVVITVLRALAINKVPKKTFLLLLSLIHI